MYHIAKLMLTIAFTAIMMIATGYATAHAADIQVDAGIGESGCDLIDAIESANGDTPVGGCTAGNGDDVIYLNGIDQLLSTAHNNDLERPTATPVINTTMVIEGDGAIISRTVGITEAFRILAINVGGNLTVRSATVSGGLSFGNDHGGGIINLGGLTMENSSLVANKTLSSTGGGIHNSGTVTLTESTLSVNHGGGSGGGIYNATTGIVAIADSSLLSNSTGESGGGIYNNLGKMTVTGSSIISNTAESLPGDGGGINNAGGVMTLENSNVSGNVAKSDGGGIDSSGAMTITNSTIAFNVADNGSAILAKGGSPALGSSIFVGRPFESTVAGSFTSLGHNLVDRADAPTGLINGINSDQVGTNESPIDAKLSPLADNGGPTLTHALLDGSPALDAGTCTLSDLPAISTDQRGLFRPIDLPDVTNVDDGCDIGAFESQLAILSIGKSASTEEVIAGHALTYTLTFTNIGPSPAADVLITDTLPLSVTYGGVVTSSVGISQPNPNVPIWQVQALQPGAYSVIFTATVDSSVSGSITNMAIISTTTPLADTDNLETSLRTTVSQLADLAISKTAFPESVTAGQALSYTLTVTNSGPHAAIDVVVTDTLPLSVTYGGVVSVPVGFTQPIPSQPVWQAAALGLGAHTIVFTGTVDSAFTGIITNTAELTTTTSLVSVDALKTSVATAVVQATSTVTGTVVDNDGNGVEGATVTMTDTVQSASISTLAFEASDTTDTNGNFRIENVPLGEYKLTVTLPGEAEPAHEQTVAVGEMPVTVVDPIVVTTKQGIYLPAIRR